LLMSDVEHVWVLLARNACCHKIVNKAYLNVLLHFLSLQAKMFVASPSGYMVP